MTENPAEDSRYTLDEFLKSSAQVNRGHGLFELETERLLELNLDGCVWIKMGAMVAYCGAVKFTRERALERGVGNLLKKAVTGEGAALTKAEGNGKVYVADKGKKISIIQMQGEEIVVNGSDLLACEESISYDISLMKKMGAMLAGGLFNVRLQGHGLIAITTHFDPLVLEVTPDQPVFTDPSATVAWSGSLTPEFKTDVSLRTFIGRGSGESIQMAFQGNGFVVVQPYEETIMNPQQAGG